MKNVVIIGASGYGKVVADIILKQGDCILGFLDDNPEIETEFIGFPVLGTVTDYAKYFLDVEFIIAIGNADIRERIAEKLQQVSWYTAIHPAAVISEIDVRIGEGTVIAANAVINSGSIIGKHCIINTGSIVEHDNQIDDFVHVSVGSGLGGTVFVGKGTWIGIGASVRNNVNICGGCMIGAGTVVVKNIEESGTYIGNPAGKIKDQHK